MGGAVPPGARACSSTRLIGAMLHAAHVRPLGEPRFGSGFGEEGQCLVDADPSDNVADRADHLADRAVVDTGCACVVDHRPTGGSAGVERDDGGHPHESTSLHVEQLDGKRWVTCGQGEGTRIAQGEASQELQLFGRHFHSDPAVRHISQPTFVDRSHRDIIRRGPRRGIILWGGCAEASAAVEWCGQRRYRRGARQVPILFADIFRSEDLSGWGKALWTLVIIVVPFLGVLIPLLTRGQSMQERAMKDAAAQEKAALLG